MTPELDRIYCGDALDILRQWPDGCANLGITSPPFNVGKDYGAGISDDRPDYGLWLSDFLREFQRVCDTCVYVFIAQKHMELVRGALRGFQQWCFWQRTNLVAPGSKVVWPWIPTVTPIAMAWCNGRKRMLNSARGVTTFDLISGAAPQSTFGGRKKRVHVAQDPIDVYYTLIARTPGDVVLDPCIGSGTAAIAARVAGRHYIGCELNPDTAALAEKRIASETRLPLFEEAVGSQDGKEILF